MSLFRLRKLKGERVAKAKVFSVSPSEAQVAKLVPQLVEERVCGSRSSKKKGVRVPGSVLSGFQRLGLVSRSAGVVKVRVACV